MSTTQLFSQEKLAAALAVVGGTALGDVRNDLLKQAIVAAANRSGGGGGSGTVTSVTSANTEITIADPTTTPVLTLADVFTRAKTFSAAGAASTPAVSITGAIFTGGSATTTKPLFLVEPSGATSTGWSTSGTALGINCASGFSGKLLDLQYNGVSALWVQGIDTMSNIKLSANGFGFFTISPANQEAASFWGAGGIVMRSDRSLIFTDGNSDGNRDTGLTRISAGVLKATNGSSGYGAIDASGYSASGTPGVTAGPFTVITSITVKNGLITAISGS